MFAVKFVKQMDRSISFLTCPKKLKCALPLGKILVPTKAYMYCTWYRDVL